MDQLLVLVGPTAIGKTNLSIKLAQALKGEIISGDSVQVYKGMNIGSAKIKNEEMAGIPHHLIDVADPKTGYTASDFKHDAAIAISEINRRKKLPILCGGTGLYVNGLLYDYHFSRVGESDTIRSNLEKGIESRGLLYYYHMLQIKDPIAAEKIHASDKKRIIRALEVMQRTGKPFSEHHDMCAQYAQPCYHMRAYALTMNREELYKRIETRVDIMMDDGLVDEVMELKKRGLSLADRAMQAIGYKEIFSYLNGECTLEMAIDTIKRNSRHFAKRQFTWFRRDPNIIWLDLDQLSEDDIFQFIVKDATRHFDLFEAPL